EQAAALVEERFARLSDQVALAAGDPRLVEATEAFTAATRELDRDPDRDANESRATRVRGLLRDYYAEQIEKRQVQLDALLAPQPSALFLQSLYLAGEGGRAPAPPAGEPRPRYADEHDAFAPVLAKLAERSGWRDLLLVEARGGRVVFSVAKTPVFQTSLIDGPFAVSNAGALFRRVESAAPGDVLFADLEPFLPRRGAPLGFAASPI